MVNISERPADAEDRAVPAHWGVIGSSASWTVRDRHLGGAVDGVHDAGAPARRLQTRAGGAGVGGEDPVAAAGGAPVADMGSRTRDAELEAGQGGRRHRSSSATRRTLAASHEREHQWIAAPEFPEGQSVHSAADLDWVAAELNDRPRKPFGYRKPDELIGHLLLDCPRANPAGAPGVRRVRPPCQGRRARGSRAGGRRVPKGTRSALEAWECRPVPAPAAR